MSANNTVHIVLIAFNSTGDESRDGRTLILPALKTLSEQGVTVLLYAGDLDYDSNSLGGQEIVRLANVKDFNIAGFENITTSDGIVHGQVKQARLFSFSRIYEAGHEAAFYQPLVTYTLFERALKGVDVASGEVVINDGYLTTGPDMSALGQENSSI
jgi:carboxypeptidase C (cathepsin A)